MYFDLLLKICLFWMSDFVGLYNFAEDLRFRSGRSWFMLREFDVNFRLIDKIYKFSYYLIV